MDDERVEARPAFRLEHGGDGAIVGRIGAEAVNRLGREGDEPARAEEAGRFGDRRGHGRPQAMNQGLEKRALP